MRLLRLNLTQGDIEHKRHTARPPPLARATKKGGANPARRFECSHAATKKRGRPRSVGRNRFLKINQSEADKQPVIDLVHRLFI